VRPGPPVAHRWLWRRYAGSYDALDGVAGYREMLDAVLAAAGPLEGLRAVEVGCGTGNVLGRLLDGGAAHVTGIDLNVEMLARSRAKLAPGLGSGTVALVEADAVAGLEDLPAGTVDVLLAVNLLYALPERDSFWKQAGRVLADAGRVVVSNPDRSGFTPAVRQQWRERGLRGFTDPRLLTVIGLNLAIDAIASTGRYSFAPWEALAAEAAAAGLDRADLRGRCYGGPVDGMNVVGTFSQS
jgi:SAM-dependent methyltransferase